jgi:hypothetical protein
MMTLAFCSCASAVTVFLFQFGLVFGSVLAKKSGFGSVLFRFFDTYTVKTSYFLKI